MPRSSCAARRPIPVRSLRSIESPSRSISSTIPRSRCRCPCPCQPLGPGMQLSPQLPPPLGIWLLAAARRHRGPRRYHQRPVQKGVQRYQERDALQPASQGTLRPAGSLRLPGHVPIFMATSIQGYPFQRSARARPSFQTPTSPRTTSFVGFQQGNKRRGSCPLLLGFSPRVECSGLSRLPPTARAYCSVVYTTVPRVHDCVELTIGLPHMVPGTHLDLASPRAVIVDHP